VGAGRSYACQDGDSVTILLEREGELAALRSAGADAREGRGSIVLVSGEAGIGKSSLVQAWTADPGADVRVLTGWCDDFLTNRALGPLHDVARSVGGPLAAAVADGDVGAVLEAALAELSYPLGATILLLEDMHWSDDATLDVVRYVGRRIEALPAVLALTYRSDDVGPGHPLTGVLGAFPAGAVRRVVPRQLSRSAVAELTIGSGLDPDDVVRITGGNPFFVTELAAAGTVVPASVGDAVLARVRKMPQQTQHAVEALSVVPGSVSEDLAQVLVPDFTDLARAERRGVLVVEQDTVRFRHELARRAVLTSLPESVQVRHHRVVLDHLMETGADAARIMHHAAGARRPEVIATYGPVAAAQAHRAGSYREAAAHHERVLARPELLDQADLARLLEEHAWTLYNLLRLPEAAEAAERAVALRVALGDRCAHVRALLTEARMLYMTSRPEEAHARLAVAASLLDQIFDRELEAEFRTHRLALFHLTDHHEEVVTEWPVVQALVDDLGRTDLRVYCDVYGGGSQVMFGEAAGLDAVRAAVGLGREHGHIEPAARAYTNLVLFLVLVRRWADAAAQVDEALRFYGDYDLRSHHYDTMSQNVHMHVLQGRWQEARALVEGFVRQEDEPGTLRAVTLGAEALLAVRAGAPDAEARVHEAWQASMGSRSESLIPSACAGMEWAWLSGDPAAAERFVGPALQKAGQTIWLGHVRWRLALLGRPASPEGVLTEPERSSLQGDWRTAAAGWAELGMPFERGVELLQAGEREAVLESLRVFEQLGAEPAARLARKRLRELGMRSIPRGPTAATRENPLGLTERQAEVLELIAEGLTNAEIAERLVVSIRTVDHHVSTVLQKLGVASRKDAAARAAALPPA
jgi:DNA-binding CsgD family transcriptional regulator